MSTLILSVILIIFVYSNTLFYSIALLLVVTGLIFVLFTHLTLHPLTGLMFLIVYVGAMMILIGYICAVCPNLILSSSRFSLWLFLFFVSFSCALSGDFSYSSSVSFAPLVGFFYSYSGISSFLTLVFILFVTLLMVTSQYITPNGPFRSVSV